MSPPSSLAVLGQSADPDSRSDAYDACLVELQHEKRRYQATAINDAVRLARKDLKSMEPGLPSNLQDLALRFLAFIFSTDDLVDLVSDHMVTAVFKDLVYIFAKADGTSCALAAVVVSLEIVSAKRQKLIKRAALSLVPALSECISIRFSGVVLVAKEVVSSIARLSKVVPDTMHALRCSWAHCVLPLALHCADNEIQAQATVCLQAVRPSSCVVGRELHKRTIAEFQEQELRKMHRMASAAEKCISVPAIWAACVRCLGTYMFRNLKLWNELAVIWKVCFSHGKPDIAIACLEAWSIVIDAATARPAKLRDLRLMRLVAKPFLFMFANNPKSSEYIQVSVRMKAIDIWAKFLNIVKFHRITGDLFQEVVRPVMLKMLLSGESATMVTACNLLGSFFCAGKDGFPLSSQYSLPVASSQSLYDFSAGGDRIQYFNEIFPHFVPVFKALFGHPKKAFAISESEFSAIRNAWRFFLRNLSHLDVNVVRSIIPELIFCEVDSDRCPIRFQYLECVFAVMSSPVWFGDNHSPVMESSTGRLCERYLAAFTGNRQDRSADIRLREDWPNFTMSLSTVCHQLKIEERLVLLSVHFLEPFFRNEKRLSCHNVVAFIHLARATCAAICHNAPVTYNVRYFHAICMDLLHSVLTSQDLCFKTAVIGSLQQQVQRFALFLFRSIIANEPFPVEAMLLKEYESGLIALLESSQPLKVYTCKFLDQAFGITPHSLPDNITCSRAFQEAVLASTSGDKRNLSSQSATMDEKAYKDWLQLYENFDLATEKLLGTPLLPDLRQKVLEKLMEQRIYFDGLLSISSELFCTKHTSYI